MTFTRALLAASLAAAVALPVAGAAVAGADEAQPVLGFADRDTKIMGAAIAGTPGETWAYRRMPLDVAAIPDVGGKLAFGPVASTLSATPQLVFERYDDASGVWAPAETPLDADGKPYRGPTPNSASARTTAHGGGVLVGRDDTLPSGSRTTVLVRNPVAPGDRYAALPAPPATVVQPADTVAGLPAETLAPEEGSGKIAIAAYETGDGSRTGLFMPLVGRDVEDGIAHWDGSAWSREPIEVPSDSDGSFTVVGVGATSVDNAFLLARTDDDAGDGIVLFRRVVDGSGPHWVEVALQAPLFAAAATPAQGVDAVAPLDGLGQQSISVGTSGVWIDGSLRTNGSERDFTLYWSIADERVTGSWCDADGSDGAALCDRPLELRFGRRAGYRSFVFDGDGFGRRVVTNPLAADGDDDTNVGTWARFDGERFERQPGAGGNYRASGGFSSPDKGWLEGPVQVGAAPMASRTTTWPVSLRSPLYAITTAPGGQRGALASGALAVAAPTSRTFFTRSLEGRLIFGMSIAVPYQFVTEPSLRTRCGASHCR